ncbi:TraM recognition domain-containing protein [Burkholderia cepacia]|uniref:TraM recognition domain-containing protein n=1 Tax=Burkholderia cepacia TaxID=292 RepID=UPI00158EE901|nr:type IV secretory system conjugative DNA transfer family protein [Burkholderia cepacia]MCA8162014.1 type IV secretory system conjugative DNA transfer family protein [Burkholderia cepacia]
MDKIETIDEGHSIDDGETAVAEMPEEMEEKAQPYDRNAEAFIGRMLPDLRNGALPALNPGAQRVRDARDRIRQDVLLQCAEYFGRKIPSTARVPFDLQDKEGDYAVSRSGVPLPQLIKASGDDCEIGYGGASLAETALLYAHPLVTVAAQACVAAGWIGLPGFAVTQAAYAIGTLALQGRNWRYAIRPTAQYTLGITAVQTAAATFLGEYAGPLVAAGNALLLGRPFLESFLANRSGKNRQFALPNVYEAPDDSEDQNQRAEQIKAAADFAKNGPVIVLARAHGVVKFQAKDPLAPDANMPMGLSAHGDLTTHMLVVGKTGRGKTYGILTPIAQQWLTLGTLRNGRFENCGGAVFLDGKGKLADELIKALRDQGLDQVLEIIRVSPEPGGQALALLEGMTPDEVTAAMMEINNSPKSNGDEFWKVSPGNWLGHSSCLLWACYEVEQMLLKKRAAAAGFDSYEAWVAHLDAEIRAKTRLSDGKNWGFTGLRQYIAWRRENEKEVPQKYADAERHFFWHFKGLNDFTMFYMEDFLFITGKEPEPVNDPKAPPRMPSIAPKLRGGLIRWLEENHPDMKDENNTNGNLIRQSLMYASRELPGFRTDLRSDLRATLSSWFTPVMRSRKLGHWTTLEKGCDILACLRGAVVGITLPETAYQKAGRIITTLAKKRIFNAIKNRPDDWKVSCPDQRPVLCIADEAQLLIGSGYHTDEAQMLSIARSLGLVCVYATQSVNEFYARMGNEGGKAFMGNFVSWVVMRPTKETNEWARDNLLTRKIFRYSTYLTGMLKTILSNDFQRAHEQALNARDMGVPELNPGQRLALLKRLRYDTSRPADVVLTEKDRKSLDDKKDWSGRLPRSLFDLGWMLTGGAVTTNVWEAVRGTVSLTKGVAHRVGGKLSRMFMGGTVEHEDYRPARFEVERRITNGKALLPGEYVELFPKEAWHLLDRPRTAMVCVSRGGVPRADICETIGKLSVEDIRAFAALQGVPTIYDEIERRAKTAANDSTQAVA